MVESIKYFDKNGTEILAGMTIKHDDGDTELVYTCGVYDEDLGVNASNEKWLEREYGEHKELFREYYPLSQFSMREWEVVQG